MMVMEEGIEISLAAVPSLQRTPLSNCFLLFLHQNSTLFLSFFWTGNCSLFLPETHFLEHAKVLRVEACTTLATTFPPAIILLSWQMCLSLRRRFFDSFHWFLVMVLVVSTAMASCHQDRSSEGEYFWEHVHAYFISVDCFQQWHSSFCFYIGRSTF